MDHLATFAPAPVTRTAPGQYVTTTGYRIARVDAGCWTVTQPDGKCVNVQDTLVRARRNVTALAV